MSATDLHLAGGGGNAAPAWHAFEVPIFFATTTHKDTKANYDTSPLRALFIMPPTDRPKTEATAFIPSTYCAPDARNHQAQRERGQFVALTADVDDGDQACELIEGQARAFAGDCAWLVYTSSSSRPGHQKWRIVVPLAQPLSYDDWYAAQTVFHNELERAGIAPDRAMARAGQPVFAPNVPHVHVDKSGGTTNLRGEDGKPLYFERSYSPLDAPGLDPFISWLALDIARLQKSQEVEKTRSATANLEAARQRAKRGPSSTSIERFNEAQPLTDLLLQFGYENSPGNYVHWQSPLQTSGSFATEVKTDEMGAERWISLSQSDKAAGLGRPNETGCSGDAFDLFVYFEHDGDQTAALAALRVKESKFDIASINFDLPMLKVDSETVSRFRLLTLEALKHEAPRKPVIKGLIARGDVGCIFGAPGAGKSVLAPYLAFRVAQGQRAFGMKTVAGPVLYVGAEDFSGMAQRFLAHAAAYGHVDQLRLADGLSGIMFDDRSPEMRDLLGSIEELAPAMIVIDTLAAGFPIDENNSVEMGKVVRICRMIASLGPAVWLVHHSPKGDSTTPRGHSILNGDLDVSVRVEPADATGVIRCRCMKNRNGFPRSFGFKIRIEALRIDEDGDTETAPVCEEIDLRSLPKRAKLSLTKLSALTTLDDMAGSDGRVNAVAWRDRCLMPGTISKAEGEKDRSDVFGRAKRELLTAKLIMTGADDAGEWVARPASGSQCFPIEIPLFEIRHDDTAAVATSDSP